MNNKDDYTLLDSGSALGKNCGPILIKLPSTKLEKKSIIAIPGRDTTANLLLSLAMPKYKNTHEVIFSEIEDSILDKKFDAGLIIHENRFTYRSKGLVKVLDLGEFWESQKQLPTSRWPFHISSSGSLAHPAILQWPLPMPSIRLDATIINLTIIPGTIVILLIHGK